MQMDRTSAVARMSAETSASAGLDDVWRWLIRCQTNPVRLEVDDLPALGRPARLRLDLPLSAPRAVLCALWLHDDVEAGGCLLVGQLRFVAHPTGSEIRLSFNGRTATALSSGLPGQQADDLARQLVDVIAESIEPPPALSLRAV
jgi:hypothetical protein